LGTIHVAAYDGRFVRGFLDHPEAGEGGPCDDVHEAALVAAKGQLFVTRYSLLKLPYTSTVNLAADDGSLPLRGIHSTYPRQSAGCRPRSDNAEWYSYS